MTKNKTGLVMPEPFTDEKKRQINELLRLMYKDANERLPFKLRYYPPYRGVSSKAKKGVKP